MRIKLISRTLLLGIILCTSQITKAQFFDGYSAGISGNLTTITADEIEDFREYASGIGIGMQGKHQLKEHLNLIIGAEFILRRAGYSRTIQTRNDDVVLEEFKSEFVSSLFLVTIPLFLEVNTPSNFYAQFGPRIDIKTGFKNGKTKVETSTGTFRDNDSIFENTETLGYGISAGLGRKFSFGGKTIAIEGRYNSDFKDLIRDNNIISLKKRSFDIWVQVRI
tara:strand:- start:24094 stop:24759 length:666 start_codon:yes stop_codon:yes gene_type:complete